MSAGEAEPTPEERLWATDPTTPPVVLAKLARFAELRPRIREHPSAYPDLVAWIDAQTAEAEDDDDAPAASADRRPLWIAAAVAALTIVAAGVTLGVTQPWAPPAGAVAAASEAADGTPTPTPEPELTPDPAPTPTPERAEPVPGTVVVPAGANLRAGPSTTAEKIGAFSHNATVEIACFVRGDTVSDALGTTDTWYAVGNGYVSAAILQPSDPSAVMPCE